MGDRQKNRDGQRPSLDYRPPPGYRDSGQPLFGPGTVIGSAYQVKTLLATLRAGQLYEARDMQLDRTVLIRGAWRDEDVPLLLTEARVIARIQDPCAVQIYGVGHHQEIEYVIAERIEGMTLADAIASLYGRGQRLIISDVIDHLTQLARSLSALHRLGLWAPRLGTRSVVLGYDQRLVMGEFALGQGMPDEELVCLVPEVINGVRRSQEGIARTAEAVDLYVLGCIAVELLIGEPPFRSETLLGLQHAHVYAPPPKLVAIREEIPRELADLVDELLAKRPQDRPASADVVVQQLGVIAARLATRRPVRVLLVDREHGRRARLASTLRRAHAALEIAVARDAEAAIASMQEAAPDVLVFDMHLEGSMNGLELCMYARGLESMHGAVLVALSDEVKTGDAAVLEQLGVVHVLERNASLEKALVEVAVRSAERPGKQVDRAGT
jgi:CheY-like chemotaxis protein